MLHDIHPIFKPYWESIAFERRCLHQLTAGIFISSCVVHKIALQRLLSRTRMIKRFCRKMLKRCRIYFSSVPLPPHHVNVSFTASLYSDWMYLCIWMLTRTLHSQRDFHFTLLLMMLNNRAVYPDCNRPLTPRFLLRFIPDQEMRFRRRSSLHPILMTLITTRM